MQAFHYDDYDQIKDAQKDLVLTKAVMKMANLCGFKGKDLSEIIGISEASATRLNKGTKLISADSKEGELALLLLRAYRSLNAILGNNPEKVKIWFNNPNRYFRKKPVDHIKKIDGLIEVVNYLDAMRGKI